MIMEATSPTDATQIRAYYEQSWSAFRKFWSNPQNLALHFGYWDEHTHDHAESLLNMNQQLATRARVKAGDRILDTGCGVGGTVFWLTTHYPVQVFGINLVAAQLDWAQTFARARGLENRVIFLQQDFLHTSFASNSFDVVWAQESACHARDKQLFLAEAYRILKPGGRLIVVDGFRFGRDISPKDEQVLHAWLSDWAIADLATQAEMLLWSRSVGFANVTLDNVESYVRPSHRRLYSLALLAYPWYWLRYKRGNLSTVKLGLIRGALNQWQCVSRHLAFEGILFAEKIAPLLTGASSK